MSGLTKGKHLVAEIDGIRCTVVETGISEERMKFLSSLLTVNHYEVKIEKEKKEDETLPDTYKIGVTDIVFNPVIAIYSKKLFLPDGKVITPAYWNQQTDHIDPRYYRFRLKKIS
jgi:hypothetical protein